MDPLLTPSSLVTQIMHLPKKPLQYATGKGECLIVNTILPEGPIIFKRRNNGASWSTCKEETISSTMLWRVVNALNTKIPIQLDRVLGASYNSRSVLETIIASCPNFFICKPDRITYIAGQVICTKAHKHLIYKPDMDHMPGVVTHLDVHGYISEVPSVDVFMDEITLPTIPNKPQPIDPQIQRMHSQMQVALCETADWLDMRSWVAIQDHGIQYHNKNILQFPFVINDLNTERVINNFPEAVKVAKNVDCIWFNGGMPFAFEVEHSTGVTSGLTRMHSLFTTLSFIRTNYVIVAADDARSEVLRKSSDPQFHDMDLWYLPYSGVAELHAFTQRHQNRGVTRDFMKSFMEPITLN